MDPSFFRTPTFTSISVTKGTLEFNTYMTGYDPYTDQIVANTFLYDSPKVTRQPRVAEPSRGDGLPSPRLGRY